MGNLRIIAGKARGRKIRTVPGVATRAITDRAKASLFNILGTDIVGASFLDLFAGTGSVGIEALSRGAAYVRFVDHHHQAIVTIQENLKITGLVEGANVMRGDAFSLLERTPDHAFDYVFIAPPQYKGLWKRAVQSIDLHPGWLTDNAWVIAQIHPVEYEALSLQRLTEFDRRHYGSTLFVFYEFRSHS